MPDSIYDFIEKEAKIIGINPNDLIKQYMDNLSIVIFYTRQTTYISSTLKIFCLKIAATLN